MDFKELKAILEFMEQNKLVEFEFEENGKRVRLRKQEGGVIRAIPAAAVSAPEPSAPASVTPPPGPAPAARPANLIEFKSPLVGTFYRSPKPGAPPFVREGDEIKPGQVLCIIEAMKVMNEIKAQAEGRVKEVLPKDGQAVEFGALLFLIENK